MNHLIEYDTPGWPGVCFLIYKNLKKKIKVKNLFGNPPPDNKYVFAYVALHAMIDQQLNKGDEIADYVHIHYNDGEVYELDRVEYGEVKKRFWEGYKAVVNSCHQIMHPTSKTGRLGLYLMACPRDHMRMDAENYIIQRITQIINTNDDENRQFHEMCIETFKSSPADLALRFKKYIVFNNLLAENTTATLHERSNKNNIRQFLLQEKPDIDKKKLQYFISRFIQRRKDPSATKNDIEKCKNILKKELPQVFSSIVIETIDKYFGAKQNDYSRSNDSSFLSILGIAPPSFNEESLNKEIMFLRKNISAFQEMEVGDIWYGRYTSDRNRPDQMERGPSIG